MEVLQPSLAGLIRQCLCSNTPRSRRRKMKWEQSQQLKQQQRQRRRLLQLPYQDNSGGVYPPSSPTPLLPARNPPLQSKEEQLERILVDMELFVDRGVKIEASTYAVVLETCVQLGALHQGTRLHRLIPPSLLKKHLSLSSKLVKLYAAFGLLEDAHHLFDEMPQRHRTKSAFSWNSLISGYVELGMYEDAMAVYNQMEEDGVNPDHFTFPRVLKACTGLKSLPLGEEMHRHAIRAGFITDPFVLNALVDMYAKCGDITRASSIFSKIPNPDSIAMNSMLSGLLRHGLISQALRIFKEMEAPDSIAISAILSGTGSLRLGEEIHCWALRQGLAGEISVGNALIAMYGEHERISRARGVFNSMDEKDLISWNSMIRAHKKDGRVLWIFREMEESGLEPDVITFVSLLDACASMGMVEEGKEIFTAMEEKFRVRPTVEHLACMVNLLGRAGFVEEAYEMVREIEMAESSTAWGALLYACSIHGKVKIAEIAAAKLFELEPDNSQNFELLAKIYDNAGRGEDEERVRRMIAERGLD